MNEAFSQLATSKKAYAAFMGCAVVLANVFLEFPQEASQEILKIVMAYIVGQGLADVGKYKREP
jgi:hypothetical protein